MKEEGSQNFEVDRTAAPASYSQPEQERSSLMLADLMKLKLPISISIGKAEVEIKNLLKARRGSVIALGRDIGEPVELIVQGMVVASGELVWSNDRYALRIKQIVSPEDRLTLCRS
jgi:flagellar motor switch protein FliN